MDGNQNNSPEVPLSQPVVPEKVQGGDEYSVVSSPEKQPAKGESLSQQQPMLPTVASDDASQIAQPASTVGVVPSASIPTTAQQTTADEADVIEKEWVVRAKNIVNKTRSDPRQQSHELSQFKAEYVQKRFSKELKVAEDAK